MKKISPHVNIYKFPITAISSISNRVTGLALTCFYIGTGCSLLLSKEKYLYSSYNSLDWKFKKIINYGIIFPFTFHTFGGIRHLLWDNYPKLLNNKSVATSSVILFGVSTLSTIFIERYGTSS